MQFEMGWRRQFPAVAVLLVACGAGLAGAVRQAKGQASGTGAGTPAAAQDGTGFTLQVGARLVVEDVSVVDRAGKPVLGLPASAFHVSEDGVAQKVVGFSEAAETEAAPVAVAAPGVHSNADMLQDRGTTLVLLLDPVTVELQDQMYLYVQAMRFVQMAPAGMRVAVFRGNNEGVPVLLLTPTADKEQLRRVLRASLPAMSRPISSRFSNAVTELRNVADVLRATPGRKAVVWLAGEFPLYVSPGFALRGDEGRQEDERKAAYRALAEARVAVYPVDVRGVLMGGISPNPAVDDEAAKKDPSTIGRPLVGESARGAGQYAEMDKLAAETGGHAFYSRNDVARAILTAAEEARTSYALSYRPANEADDGRWRKVRITVDGPYAVAYRTGYFARSAAGGADRDPARKVLTAGGATVDSARDPESAGDAAARPIAFSVRVMESAAAGKATRLKLRYVVPTAELRYAEKDGAEHARFRMMGLAYNAWGDVLGHSVDVVETHYTAQQMSVAERIGTPADQTLEVPRGAGYLLLAVEDLTTGRVGTVQMTVPEAAARK